MLSGGNKEKHKAGSERWAKIATAMRKRNIKRTAKQCQDKWESLHTDWKTIFDHERHLGSGKSSYWDLSIQDKRTQRLPTNFYVSVYNCMLLWLPEGRDIDPGDLLMDSTVHNSTPMAEPNVSGIGNMSPQGSPNTPRQEQWRSSYGASTSASQEATSPSKSPGMRGNKKQRPSGATQGILSQLEKNNNLLLASMANAEQGKLSRHSESLAFEKTKLEFVQQPTTQKIEVSKELGYGYINAPAGIGEGIKMLGQAILHQQQKEK